MSITFDIQAPRSFKLVPCTSPSLGLTCTKTEPCGYCDNGWEEVEDATVPLCNFSDSNAMDLLRLLQLAPLPYGKIEVSTIPLLLRLILRLKNTPQSRAHLVQEPYTQAGSSRVEIIEGMPTITVGPTLISCGNLDDQTLRRLEELETLFVSAVKSNKDVLWF